MPDEFYVKDFGGAALRPLIRLFVIDTHVDGRLSDEQQAVVRAAFSGKGWREPGNSNSAF